MRVVLDEALVRALVTLAAGLDQIRLRHRGCGIRRRENVVRGVTIGTRRHADETEFRHLAVERAPERLDDVGVTGTALGRDVEPEPVVVRALNRVRRVAVHADRRRVIAGDARRGMHALLVSVQHALVTGPAGGRDVRAEDTSRLVVRPSNVVLAVTVGASRRHGGEPRLLLGP